MRDVVLVALEISEFESLIEKSVERALSMKMVDRPEVSNDDLLTVPGAATLLSLSVSTIYSLVSKREIPFLKPSGSKRVYFLKADLLAYLKEGRQKTNDQIKEEITNINKPHKKRSKI